MDTFLSKAGRTYLKIHSSRERNWLVLLSTEVLDFNYMPLLVLKIAWFLKLIILWRYHNKMAGSVFEESMLKILEQDWLL